MLKNLKSFNPKEVETDVFNFWNKNKIFEKSLKKSAPKGNFIFYDGPPFATGTPHYGHIVGNVLKDAVPRYWTMNGYHVDRKWGWDCHGLPIENIVEKKLGIKRKKEIEEFGIEKFNEECRDNIFGYVDEWEKVIGRLGRWADMKNPYRTMDSWYMESVWWVFKQLWEKGLIYEGYRSMHICTRCETTLSQQEVAEGYKNIKDLSATVKFELKNEPGIYVLAWTTTPWTLMGNVALAVGKDVDYVKVNRFTGNWDNKGKAIYDQVILAKAIYSILEKNATSLSAQPFHFNSTLVGTPDGYESVQGPKIVEKFKGSYLIGKEYKPLFDYYLGKGLDNEENGWKIYHGDFVATEEGTGIVHIAPAFGEDDLKLAQEYKLPFIQHVGMDGRIKSEAIDFSGLSVKPEGDHQSTDIEVIKYLDKRGLLFAKEKYEHSYPHCWRCETPLINYATSSWFVDVVKLKPEFLKLAKKINWVPEHLKEGRFGNWLEGARDWSISRQRFWASVIPLWKCQSAEQGGINPSTGQAGEELRGKNEGGCGAIKVIGSVEDIKKNVKKSGNNYFAMRHGEAECNAKNILNSDVEKIYHLTKKGQAEVERGVKKLKLSLGKNKKIDLIIASDFIRAKETAEIVANELGLGVSEIIYDKRLRELNMGSLSGKNIKEYYSYFSSEEEEAVKSLPGGENMMQVKRRMGDFIYDIDKKYSDKNILIISHEYPLWQLYSASNGADIKKTTDLWRGERFLKTGEIKKLDFVSMPHNGNYELDLHRPYIDEIKFRCKKCGREMKRIPDVLDTWFDSGSMPYAQAHYPFENKNKFEKNFPAEFIAEGIDQTRAWFYYLHVIATALKHSNAYKNVIVNGIVLAEDGKKMSKRLKNYPDPMYVIDKYGADALRLYLLNSPVVKAENLNFSEKGVDEVYKKTISRLWNVFMFYQTYADQRGFKRRLARRIKSENVLDQWILARLNQLIGEITINMNAYELDKATRPINDFVDDLSTWYIRRSRNRFTARGLTQNEPAYRTGRRKLTQKKIGQDKKSAQATTRFILSEFSKTVAPFMPFISEALYKSIDGEKKSVHLENWPDSKKLSKTENELIEKMKAVREIVAEALALRASAGIKVRQPLALLKIKNQKLKIRNHKDLLKIIADEVNVKKIVFDKTIGDNLELDRQITPGLKKEGQVRDLVRIVQDLRKEAGYVPKDKITVFVRGDYAKNIIKEFEKDLKSEVGAREIRYVLTDKIDAEIKSNFDGNEFWLGIKKLK